MIRNQKQYLGLTFDLINAFSLVKNPHDTALLMQNLLTESEIRNLAQRLRIAKLILSGEKHRDIANKTQCSIATVTKVSIWLKTAGEGLDKIIDKLPEKYEYPKDLPKVPLEFQLPKLIAAGFQYSAAKLQEKPSKKLYENMQTKRIIDKNLKESYKLH